MPIANAVDIEQKLIYSTCTGVMVKEDFDIYVREIWSHKNHYGFNELFDTVQADWNDFDFSYLLSVAETAVLLNTIDPNSKLAWVVLEGKQKELTNFYKAAKSLTRGSSRTLEAFYSRDEAMAWINLED